MSLYLEMNETGLPALSTVGVSIRVEIPNVEAAPALRDELAARFFVGHTYEAKIHKHYTDQPCELIDLPE